MIKHIALIGAGAVGCVLAEHFTSVEDFQFSLVAVNERAHALEQNGIRINGKQLFPSVISSSPNIPIDLLIVCVKNYSLSEAITDFAPFICEETIILPFLNGIAVHDQLALAFPSNRILYGIISKIDAHRVHNETVYNLSGDIVFGYKDNVAPAKDVLEVLHSFHRAKLHASIGMHMEREVWKKWMLNVGANQVSALTGADYLTFSKIPAIKNLLVSAMTEIINLASAANVDLTNDDLDSLLHYLLNYPYPKKTSMLQDIEAKRKTEIDEISKVVISLGKRYGVPTPVNETLYYAIKAKESTYLLKNNGGSL